MPFLLAGCPPILCALIMLLIHRVKDDKDKSTSDDVVPHIPDRPTYPVHDMPEEKIHAGYTHSSGQMNVSTTGSAQRRPSLMGRLSAKLSEPTNTDASHQVSLTGYTPQASAIMW